VGASGKLFIVLIWFCLRLFVRYELFDDNSYNINCLFRHLKHPKRGNFISARKLG